jgi:bidirectional [NiFe] hydrogenase diaphorase subunit
LLEECEMGTSFRKPVAPSADKRWKIVEASMRRLGNQSHALIEALHTVQEAFGYLDCDSLRFVATSLRVPLSQAFGVATFYHYFSMKPPGKHTCVVCTGTACYIKGAGKLLNDMEAQYGIKPGETTPDGNVSLITARCLGACGLAPAVVFDGQVAGKVNSAYMLAKAGRWGQ